MSTIGDWVKVEDRIPPENQRQKYLVKNSAGGYETRYSMDIIYGCPIATHWAEIIPPMEEV